MSRTRSSLLHSASSTFFLSAPVGLAVVRMGDVEKRKRPESLFAVSRHSLVDRISGQEAAVQVGQRNTDDGILKNGSPSLHAACRCDSRSGRSMSDQSTDIVSLQAASSSPWFTLANSCVWNNSCPTEVQVSRRIGLMSGRYLTRFCGLLATSALILPAIARPRYQPIEPESAFRTSSDLVLINAKSSGWPGPFTQWSGGGAVPPVRRRSGAEACRIQPRRRTRLDRTGVR